MDFKNYTFNLFKQIVLIFFIGAAIVSCSGGGGSSSSTISGTAATGLPLEGTVNVYGSNGGSVLDVAIDASGNYTADVSGLTAPYFLCAVPDDNSLATQYSFASEVGTTNIIPLTTLTLFYANGEQDPGDLISTWPASSATVTNNTANIQAIINANLVGQFSSQNIDFTTYNFFSAVFSIGDSFDQILDQITIEITGGSATVSIEGNAIFVLNLDIDTSNININGSDVTTAEGSGTVSITGAGTGDLPVGSLNFVPASVTSVTTTVTWLDDNGTAIGITLFENNIVALSVASNGALNNWIVASGLDGIPGTSFDGTTARFENVALASSNSPDITVNGDLNK